ncbi:MAG: phosphate propanoyltransferase [Fusobacteriaceae bacterium]
MDLNRLVELVKEKLEETRKIPIEASGRHIHLSQTDAKILFGENYEFNILKELSQPGQVAYKERLRLVGPKGVIDGVVILGPCRDKTQVELSMTDCKSLGIKPVIRNSGDVSGTPGVIILNGDKIVKIEEGVIVANRHIHMTPEDADNLCVKDKDIVNVKVMSERPVIFEDVLVRVNSNFKLNMHIDYDEANACYHTNATYGILEKK